jgi:methionyl-tRNA formyltransferase
VVFAGTPEFAVPCLQALLAGPEQVLAVYSQPDRPAGRGRKLTPSPVKATALAARIPVLTPETLKSKEVQAELAALTPDLLIVVAFGMILPKKVLAIPRLGCWNVHASLLPRWRGAAPIQRAIEAGDSDTGVCLMQMQAGLDTGPVYLRLSTAITPEDTGQSLHDRLSALGADVLLDGLARLRQGTLPNPVEQSTEGVNYAHKLDKSEALLDFSQPAQALAQRIRAFLPFPVAQAEIAGELLQILAAEVSSIAPHETPPGRIVAANKRGIEVACGVGVLRITELRRAGGKAIRAVDYLNVRAELKC